MAENKTSAPPPAAPAAPAVRDKAAEKAAQDAAALGLPEPGQGASGTDSNFTMMMDSAELATRSATLAADVSLNLRTAVKDLGQVNRKQNLWTMILMAVVGTLMVAAAALFGIMTLRMQDRVAMLDEMLVAVGKRVTEMDATLELVGGAQESLQAVATKQGEMVASQAKMDARLDEVLKSAKDMPELTGKQVEQRMQALSKQVAALEARLQTQGSSSARMATQLQTMQGALGENAALKRELELMARQQRERQAQDASQAAQAATKARERLVQYPRVQNDKP